MPGSTGQRLGAVLAMLTLLPCPIAGASSGLSSEDYLQLVERYRSADEQAARVFAGAVRSSGGLPSRPCHGREQCEAAAVLNLDAAALLVGEGQENPGTEMLDATRRLVARQASGFAFEWLLAAAALHQGSADHARAFGLYARALELRPRDPVALLGQATALEFSAIPDGFGGIVVADRDIWRLLQLRADPPPELAYLLANPRADAPYRRLLLEHLSRQYRDILRLDDTQIEARLRLGRVLEERGHHAEAEAEMRAVTTATSDPFLLAIAKLCLARFETSPEREAAAYQSVLDVDPSLGPAWLGLSRALLAGGDRAGAVAAVEHALSPKEPRPASAWVDYHLGRHRAFPRALQELRERVTRKRAP